MSTIYLELEKVQFDNYLWPIRDRMESQLWSLLGRLVIQKTWNPIAEKLHMVPDMHHANNPRPKCWE